MQAHRVIINVDYDNGISLHAFNRIEITFRIHRGQRRVVPLIGASIPALPHLCIALQLLQSLLPPAGHKAVLIIILS